MQSRSSSRSTTELREEGWARDIVHGSRSGEGAGSTSQTGSRSGSPATTRCWPQPARREQYISSETLATSISYESLDGIAPVEIDGRTLQIGVAVA